MNRILRPALAPLLLSACATFQPETEVLRFSWAAWPGEWDWKVGHHNVIATDETSVLYEWRSGPCLGWPDQHEIGKIVYGRYDRFVFGYTVKVHETPSEQRDVWVQIVSTARVGAPK